MPPYRPPFPAGAPRNGGPVAVRSTPSPVRSVSPPRLRIMVAGVDKDTRGPVEASVRHALGSQAEVDRLYARWAELEAKARG